MQTIPMELIEETWNGFDESEPGDADLGGLVENFFQHQPGLGIYLTVADEMIGEERDDSQLIPLCLLAWKCLSSQGQLTAVEPEMIEEVEDKNSQFLEKLEEGSEMNWNKAVEQFLINSNQAPLLSFALSVLMSPYEDCPDLAPETLGLEFLKFKIVLDCLDQ